MTTALPPTDASVKNEGVKPSWLLVLVVGVGVIAGHPAPTRAQTVPPVRVRYWFQPDCYRPSLTAACDRRKTGQRLDLGPQIAIWVESADGTRFVDTLM